MKNVVITGASTGIGLAIAERLVGAGYRVFGSVRKEAVGQALQARLGERFVPLIFDVTDEAGVAAGAARVAEVVGDEGLAGLVNNAGLAEPGPLMHLPVEQLRNQFEVNVFGVHRVTLAFLPLLGAVTPARSAPGRIVNISSVGGRIVAPFLGAYAASKHAIEALSDALRRELVIYGIDVIVVQPGAIATPIWDKAEEVSLGPLQNTPYATPVARFQKAMVRGGRAGFPPDAVAKIVQKALEARRPKARYPLPNQWIFSWLLPRALPDRVLDRMMSAPLGMKRLPPG